MEGVKANGKGSIHEIDSVGWQRSGHLKASFSVPVKQLRENGGSTLASEVTSVMEVVAATMSQKMLCARTSHAGSSRIILQGCIVPYNYDP